jgi:ABC-type branched-subunit amino acid transport system permease subunit
VTATIVAQQAINGIVLGSLYVLVALGLTLIYGVLVQINFAHADFVTLGAFAAYFFMHVLGRQLSGEHRRRAGGRRRARLGDQLSRSSRRCAARAASSCR